MAFLRDQSLDRYFSCSIHLLLSSVISKFRVTHHFYADDTQIYIGLDTEGCDAGLKELSNCLDAVQTWMGKTMLKLNPDKTEFILLGSSSLRQKLASFFPAKILGNDIFPSDVVKNLGVYFESDHSFTAHISNVCRSCYYHLKDFHRIRKHLNQETAIMVGNAKVSSRLDYCNSLLYGISKTNIAKLQRVQNALCRTVCRLDRHTHISPHLQKLHWLPIKYRIIFKYNLITFKAITVNKPLYLSSMIKSSVLTRGNRLSVSTFHPNKQIGHGSFQVSAPVEWNRLPPAVRSQTEITSFRNKLKTHLFRLAIHHLSTLLPCRTLQW